MVCGKLSSSSLSFDDTVLATCLVGRCVPFPCFAIGSCIASSKLSWLYDLPWHLWYQWIGDAYVCSVNTDRSDAR
jgi:hypothetical protein